MIDETSSHYRGEGHRPRQPFPAVTVLQAMGQDISAPKPIMEIRIHHLSDLDDEELDARLAAVRQEEPPAELRRRIRAALPPPPRRQGATPPRTLGDLLREWLLPSPVRSLAYVAAGLLIGVLVAPILLGPGADVPSETFAGTALAPAPTMARQLTLPGLDGSLAVARDGDRLAVDLRLAADGAGFTVEETPEKGVFRLTVTADGEVVLEERLALADLPTLSSGKDSTNLFRTAR